MRSLSFALGLAVLSIPSCGDSAKAPASNAVTPPRSAPPAAVEPDSAATPATPPVDPSKRGEALAHEVIILDGHIDVPWRLEKAEEAGGTADDVTQATEGGDFDLPRARAGGLDAPFMSIYVSPKFEGNGAKSVADALIDRVEGIVARAPGDFALARSPAEVRANFAAGKISLPMGMENGAPIEKRLENVTHFRDRGIRYITLAHSKDNHISDSSYDDRHTHGGLSRFGEKVVAEMNRVGIMIDVSHISDDAFDDVMRLSVVPVIASHSSCRHFTPGFERNMSDAMIRRLAEAGGVIQINFGSGFLDGEVRKQRKAHEDARGKALEGRGLDPKSEEGKAAAEAYDREHPPPRATVGTVADHIEHVIALVGVDHVGLGSDFDGVGDSLPKGLRDVSGYPNLLQELLERGHDRAEIEKIAGLNVLRVWQAVEDHAAAQGGEG